MNNPKKFGKDPNKDEISSEDNIKKAIEKVHEEEKNEPAWEKYKDDFESL